MAELEQEEWPDAVPDLKQEEWPHTLEERESSAPRHLLEFQALADAVSWPSKDDAILSP